MLPIQAPCVAPVRSLQDLTAERGSHPPRSGRGVAQEPGALSPLGHAGRGTAVLLAKGKASLFGDRLSNKA